MTVAVNGNSTSTVGGSNLATFIAQLQAVAQIRALCVIKSGDTTTTVNAGPSPRTWTQSATIAGRTSAQGSGILATYALASTQNVTSPDTADLSFTTGTVDQPFSVVVLANVTDTANARGLLDKYSGSGSREWMFRVSTADKLELRVCDTTDAHRAIAASNAAITQGALHLFGASFAATSPFATAANDITLYQDAAVIASTATNDASYPGMSDTNSVITAGGSTNAAFLDGSLGFWVLYAGALTTAQHLAVKTAVNTFYGTAL